MKEEEKSGIYKIAYHVITVNILYASTKPEEN